jgi:LysR family transcriptional regulator, glycine cleavage system transcriptional activator
MRRGRLPLTALRSFEAAGRHLSFSKAAEELFVSQAAVSRQIRELEIIVGRPLFERLHRRVELTDGGRNLLEQLTKSFDDIDRRLKDIVVAPVESVLTISVEPSLAACWLVPRLNQFRKLRPDIDIAIDVDPHVIEFRNHSAELALRYSAFATSWPRTEAERLAPVFDTPVLSPALRASGPVLARPEDLRHYTLLHEESRQGWACWFKAAGVADATLERGPLLADGALAKQAALLGHGVALGDLLLVEEELKAGTLVRPFEIDVASGAYWLVAPSLAALSEPARAFADWIRGEFASHGYAAKRES